MFCVDVYVRELRRASRSSLPAARQFLSSWFAEQVSYSYRIVSLLNTCDICFHFALRTHVIDHQY